MIFSRNDDEVVLHGEAGVSPGDGQLAPPGHHQLGPAVLGLAAVPGPAKAEALGAALPAGLGEAEIPSGAGGALLTNRCLLARTLSCFITLTNSIPETQ